MVIFCYSGFSRKRKIYGVLNRIFSGSLATPAMANPEARVKEVNVDLQVLENTETSTILIVNGLMILQSSSVYTSHSTLESPLGLHEISALEIPRGVNYEPNKNCK
ncbi:MAG: hypothetical protein QXF06_06220 [Archaeoglobaceae archaeon]